MRRKFTFLLLFGFSWLLTGPVPFEALAANNYVAVFQINGPINPISARYLTRCIDKATDDGARAIVIKLNTPGGMLSSTRKMVKEILNAKIPLVIYVSPPGAHAASAGTFITVAANFAVMAPGTNIGAASPVDSGGKDLPKTLGKKVKEDTMAFIRSIAVKRNRNSKALEKTVTEAKSYSAEEAVEKRIVDFIANDMTDLLAQLDGRKTETANYIVTLSTKKLDILNFEMTLLEKFLTTLSNPDITFMLLSIGQMGILAELFTPGFIGPGVVGVISFALAFIGLGNLPVNWVGVGLLLFSMLLFFLEFQQPGIGIFGIGGLVSFVLGGFILFGDFGTSDIPLPTFRVSIWVITVITGIIGAFLLSFLYFIGAVTRSRLGTVNSREELIGQSGMVVSDLAPSGTVMVGGELQTATTNTRELITEGEEVIVIGVYENVLKVSKVPEDS